MIRTIFALAFVLFAFLSFSQSTPSIQLEMEYKEVVLQGVLDGPAPTADSVLVLIIPGSGPTDRNGNNPIAANNSLKLLSDGLIEEGFFTFRFDKRGVGASIMDPALIDSMTFDMMVEDVIAWKSKLEKDLGFENLILLGHSQGSLIAALVHQVSPASKIVSLAGASRSADVLIIEQLKNQNEKLANDAQFYFKQMAKGDTLGPINPFLNGIFHPKQRKFLESYIAYDPSEEYAKITVPVLVINGSTDLQVQVSEAQQLDAIGLNSQLKILEGMNHVLKEVDTLEENTSSYYNPDLPLHPDLVESIVQFLMESP